MKTVPSCSVILLSPKELFKWAVCVCWKKITVLRQGFRMLSARGCMPACVFLWVYAGQRLISIGYIPQLLLTVFETGFSLNPEFTGGLDWPISTLPGYSCLCLPSSPPTCLFWWWWWVGGRACALTFYLVLGSEFRSSCLLSEWSPYLCFTFNL